MSIRNSILKVIVILYLSPVSGNITHFGNAFMLAFPNINGEQVCLSLYTIEPGSIQVTIYEKKRSVGKYLSFARRIQKLTLSYNEALEYIVIKSTYFDSLRESDIQPCLKLNSTKAFTINVYIYTYGHVSGGYLAMPIGSWGRRYYAVTLWKKSFIIVLSDQKSVHLKIKFRKELPSSIMLSSRLNYSKDSESIFSTNESMFAYVIHKCVQSHNVSTISLAGTMIESGTPIGVINGNCEGFMKTQECSMLASRTATDFAIEMLFPEYTFGKIFVTLSTPMHRNRDTIMVIATDTETDIVFHGQKKYEGVRGIIYVPAISEGALVTSSHNIALAYIMASSCTETDANTAIGPSLGMIIPNDMFYNSYVWWRPADDVTLHYVVLIMNYREWNNLLWNGKKPGKSYSHSVLAWTFLQMYTYVVNEKHLALSSANGFGCYFYGLGRHTYFLPGGFHYNHTRKLECVIMPAVINDETDNDCDGDIDEEFVDQKDNDNDGLIDEDTFYNPCNSYYYGITCQKTCFNCIGECQHLSGACKSCMPGFKGKESGCHQECGTNEFGENCHGNCLKKCGGMDCSERTSGVCYVCEPFQFGSQCRNSCINCETACDPVTGYCNGCKAGFKDSDSGCQTPCGEFQFGKDCLGDCYLKCGSDCAFRTTGKCRDKMNNSVIHSVGWAFLLVTIVVTFAFFLTKKLNKTNLEEAAPFTFNQFSSMGNVVKEPDSVSQANISLASISVRSHASANVAPKEATPETLLDYGTPV